ncbi:phage terminase large subunit family protein [Candidatus Pacearchaeota archaeon]|nr:phage terminase large subunit family protein [Candidatus Pacearchaeota archaeon]
MQAVLTRKQKDDCDFIIESIDDIKSKAIVKNVLQVAEEYRVFPNGTPFPGKFEAMTTPYMIEPMMELSPQSSTEVLAFMKPAQIGGTAMTAENRILFEIAEDPGPLLYVTATDDLAREWGEKRLEPMLELCGLDSRIKPFTQMAGKKTTGNRTTSKTYVGGGSIFATSYNRAGTLRMTSFRTVILDEIDAPHSVGHEGDPRKIAEARSTAYEGRKKILLLSTPLIKQTSKIYKAFLDGDQRYYHVACPFCGRMQKLSWSGNGFGIKYKQKNGIVEKESVYYECEKCHGKIKNYHKAEMLTPEIMGGRAKWIAENPNAKEDYKSYSISAIYAPPGMITWEKLAQEWVDAQGDPELLRAFINLRLGQPYEERGEAPKLSQVIALKDNYKRGTIPESEKQLIATLGCDVQRGTDDGRLPARIEAELCGFSEDGKTWSIDYYSFEGSVDDPHSGAFKKLKDAIMNGGFPIMPTVIFIDAGYKSHVVYEFCRGSNSICPVMGSGYLRKPNGKSLLWREKTLIEYGNVLFYEVNSDVYKERLFARLFLKKDMEGNKPSGYCSFPFDYSEKYFKMLLAEKRYEIVKNGKVVSYEWRKVHSSSSNEALDVRVYAMTAFDVYVQSVCVNVLGMESLNYRQFWNWAKS